VCGVKRENARGLWGAKYHLAYFFVLLTLVFFWGAELESAPLQGPYKTFQKNESLKLEWVGSGGNLKNLKVARKV